MVSKSILHLVASSRGGGAMHMQELSTALACSGNSVLAVMPLDGGNVGVENFEATSVRFIPLPHSVRYPGQWIKVLAEIFKAEAPTIIHAHGSRAAFWTYWALWWARLTKVHLVVTVHGFVTPFHRQPHQFLQLMMERLVARRASAIMAVAEAEREALLQARIAPPVKVFTVHLGFDLSSFTGLESKDRTQARLALEVSPEATLLLTICRLDRPRDFKTLLSAFRRVADTNPQSSLFIVGGGPLRIEVEALIEQWELTGRVKLWGFRRDVITFYAAADIFVLTSWGWEGLPLTLIEAQAAGIPVVASDAGGAREAFSPNKTGFLVPRSDPEALALGLLNLVTDSDRRHRMGLAGRKFVTAQFKLERMVKQTAEIYQSLF